MDLFLARGEKANWRSSSTLNHKDPTLAINKLSHCYIFSQDISTHAKLCGSIFHELSANFGTILDDRW